MFRESKMENIHISNHTFWRRDVLSLLMLVALAILVFLPNQAVADEYVEAPPFVFNDRCVPYEVTPAFFLASGVDPDKMISAFVDGGDGVADPEDFPGDVSGTGNNGSFAPWTADFDEEENPVPCDEFHTNKRRTRYEGCHFYDGTPCYFSTNGQLDQDSFTPDAAGRRAFEIGEHFVFYEFTQQFEQNLNPMPGFPDGYTPAPLFTDPYAAGFAVGTQTKIMNAAGDYWDDDPLGLWKQGLVNFTKKAGDCRMDFVDEDCIFLHDMVTANGQSSQQIGYPLVYTGDELFELSDRDLVSIRYRLGGDGAAGAQESARYILCPLHKEPANGDISAGNDIIQAYPAHIEWQPPSQFLVIPRPGYSRASETIALANPFGPTPPPGTGPFAESKIVENFICLQETGNWCP
jgi:hypothetical protein